MIDSKCESGKGRCSFNPNVNTVSVMINEELSQECTSISWGLMLPFFEA